MEERQQRSAPTAAGIELGSVDPEAFASPREAVQREPRGCDDLHICPACGSGFVYPTDWAPASGRRWSVELRCPECEWRGGGIYPQAVVDRFDDALDTGVEALLADLEMLARANMETWVDSFAGALETGQLLPEDF